MGLCHDQDPGFGTLLNELTILAAMATCARPVCLAWERIDVELIHIII